MSRPDVAGRPAPAWVASMAPARWYRISGDAPDLGLAPTPPGTRYLCDNDPARDAGLNPARSWRERARRALGREWAAPWRGRVGFAAITEAWNGAVYASRAGPAGAMLVFGGGHDDYFGSDMHAFDVATRQWRRLSTGYVDGGDAAYGAGAVYPDSVYPDGSPLPPHTYHYVQYDPCGNDYLLLKGQIELGPHVRAVPVPHLFNLDTLRWRRGPRHPSARLDSGGCSTWDARRRVLWGHCGDDGGGNAFVAYSPDGANADGTFGAWTACHPSKLPGEASHNAMQIHPLADRILLVAHRRNALLAIDPAAPDAPAATVAARGAQPRLRAYAALEYAPGLQALVYYAAADGAQVHAIAWDGRAEWRTLVGAGGLDPIADAAAHSRHARNLAHTFGRFRVAHFAGHDVALLIRHVDSPVYALRLPARL